MTEQRTGTPPPEGWTFNNIFPRARPSDGSPPQLVPETCILCLDELATEKQLFWPHCGHAMHSRCLFRFWCAQGTVVDSQWPALDRISEIHCPMRGAVITSANAIEACLQRWGTDDEAHRRYEEMTAWPVPASAEIEAQNTAHAVVEDYSDRAFARDDVPPPPAPTGIVPLCHHHVGPPPDFSLLLDRRMIWAPLAMHDPVSRSIIGWVQQWTCNTCSAAVTLHDAQPRSAQMTCTVCHAPYAWIFEPETSSGEWRCPQAHCNRGNQAFVQPVPPPEDDVQHQA